LSVCNVEVIQPFSNSVHCKVEFSVFSDCTNYNEELGAKRCEWSKADYDDLSEYISGVDRLDMLSTNLTENSLWVEFSDVLQAATNMCASNACNNSNVKCKRWYPAAVR